MPAVAFRSLILLLPVALAALSVFPSNAQSGRWNVADGRAGTARASLLSSNTLTVGSRLLEYHPQLTIGCDGDGWSQSLVLRNRSGSEDLPLTVQIDGRSVSETWSPTGRGGGLARAGKDGITRLARAKRLRLAWSNGLFSGSGEAVFNLAGIGDVVSRLEAACGD